MKYLNEHEFEVNIPKSDTTMMHQAKILLLYGSLRERSYSRLLIEEAERILSHLGAETRIFDPEGLLLLIIMKVSTILRFRN